MFDEKTNWFLHGAQWIVAAIVAQWVSWNASYHTLVYMMAIEWAISSALVIKRGGIAKWCNYASLWSLFAKFVTGGLVFSVNLMSDALGNHLAEPIELGSWVAIAFSLQQFITIVKNARNLDVDPPPLVDVLLSLATDKIAKIAMGVAVEKKGVSISPSGEVSTNQETTTVRPLTEIEKTPLVIPATDVVKDKI